MHTTLVPLAEKVTFLTFCSLLDGVCLGLHLLYLCCHILHLLFSFEKNLGAVATGLSRKVPYANAITHTDIRETRLSRC